MAVPAHDQRDLEFCRKYGLPVRVVVERKEVEGSKLKVEKEKEIPAAAHRGQKDPEEAFAEYGVSVNSGPYSGMESATAMAKMTAFAKQTRWIRLWIRPGIFTATAIRRTTRPLTIRQKLPIGFPLTSTLAESRTRFCTCCTRGSGAR